MADNSYTDSFGVERCEECAERVEECMCDRCPECGDQINECTCNND